MKNKKFIVVLSLINVIRSMLLVLQALFSKFLIDDVVNGRDFLLTSIIFISLIVSNVAFNIAYLAIKNHFLLAIEVGMKQEIYNQLIKKDYNEAKRFHSGEITNIYLSDIQNIKAGLCETIPGFFLYISRFVLSFIALFFLDAILLLILLGVGIIILIGAKLYGNIIKKYHKQSLESDGKLNAYMQESFENLKIVKASNSQINFINTLNEKIKDNYNIKKKRNIISIFGNGGLHILMQICSGFTMVYGAIGIFFGTISYGDLVGLLQIVSYFESPLSMFSQLLNRYHTYKVSQERINELLSLKDEVEQEDISTFDKIEIKNISFKFDKNQIYSNYSLTINKNDTILLKGQSGCGKTTLFNLLLGFETPYEGTIEVYNGNKILPINKCRNLFSYVFQENILFSGTIEENIKLFVPNAEEEDIIFALKTACIYDEIMEKPLQLKTELNERGSGLSIGQIQRILLAISLLKDNPILLLDEFTSALDKDLEKQIVINVSKLPKTKIIITHRDISIANAKIIYLGDNDE